MTKRFFTKSGRAFFVAHGKEENYYDRIYITRRVCCLIGSRHCHYEETKEERVIAMQELFTSSDVLPEETPAQEPAKEPEVLIKQEKQEKYTFLHMIRNVFVMVAVILVLFRLSPFEVVTVSSSSMAPALPVGSISIAKKTDERTEYKVGDIITFEVEYDGTYYSRVTHRVVEVYEDGTIQTKGDHNPEVDPFTIQSAQVKNRILWENIFNIG